MLDRLFRLSENNATIRTEALAGLTTFLTMAYIIFVQPAVLSGALFGAPTGMDFGAVMFATCVSAAIATVIMGLYARYPIALAPGMGENFFFVISVMPAAAAAGFAQPWRVGLGVVFVSGVLFFLLYFMGIRERIFDTISPAMKHAMAVGIGLFIAFIGLQNAGVIVSAATLVPGEKPFIAPGTLVRLNTQFSSPDLLVFFCGLIVAAALYARGVRGSLLWGILAAAVLAIGLRLALPVCAPHLWASDTVRHSHLCARLRLPDPSRPWWQWFVALPPSPAPVFFRMDVAGAFHPNLLPYIVVFLVMDVLDTIGTLVGVGEQAGFIVDNKLPRAREAMLADQTGTVVGAVLGTSTVTSYIESAAGVQAGGRTGLTGLVVAALFLLALFFSPLVALVGSYAPITAPALVLVGALMTCHVAKIPWSDYTESVPAFLTLIAIPLSYSIADGLAVGFISYALIKLAAGRGREAGWLNYLLAGLLLVYFVFIRGGIP
jgi:AGZA family xanthine/uracil permease-like MFS transporter